MPLYQVTVYHNDTARFAPHDADDQLTAVLSFARDLPEGTTAHQVADWTFHAFNADLETLESVDTAPGLKSAFLLASLYRLLRLKSMSVGDVVRIATGGGLWWLACDRHGWSAVAAPLHLSGHVSTAARVYQVIAERHQR